MKTEEIREAVEILKRDGFWGENKNVKAFNLLLELAEDYLKASEEPPREKDFNLEVCKWRGNRDMIKEVRGECKGYNSALKDYTCSLMKRVSVESLKELREYIYERCEMDDKKTDEIMRRIDEIKITKGV